MELTPEYVNLLLRICEAQMNADVIFQLILKQEVEKNDVKSDGNPRLKAMERYLEVIKDNIPKQ